MTVHHTVFMYVLPSMPLLQRRQPARGTLFTPAFQRSPATFSEARTLLLP
jgi:hypothetical protein